MAEKQNFMGQKEKVFLFQISKAETEALRQGVEGNGHTELYLIQPNNQTEEGSVTLPHLSVVSVQILFKFEEHFYLSSGQVFLTIDSHTTLPLYPIS